MAPERSKVDLTPDPRVLRALTHTPLRPIDALCELIDNAIDSFGIARATGRPVNGALILLTIPSRSELAEGAGAVVIRDNGPGLGLADAEKALRAGFSGNNPFDTLGLFGMGFNIATGKIGTTTRFMTLKRDDPTREAVQITIDLPEMERSRSYDVPVAAVRPPDGFEHGTQIEVSGWWPSGNPNHDFIHKLASITKPKLREEIGRRYATILRRGEVRILVNGGDCKAFEHCVWSENRSVDRQVLGRIPAKYVFNQVTGTQTRCGQCFRRLEDNADCPDCGPGTIKRTLEERIRGWVGIQRYDDADHFGIDLIRNGRAIRVLEKEAFFTFTDELGKKVTDYPIDGPHGRIVGEVHLDHVPVDFMKQDFQRSSREWDEALRFLRGESSLQPRQPGANQNSSYLYKLYQGYRRVRNVGKRDLYMGSWDPDQRAGVRVSRTLEQEYLEKFRDGVPGWYDDSEWWKLVEAADQAPIQGIKNCPNCGAQVLESDEQCSLCDAFIQSKACLNCAEKIPASAQSCPNCGTSQLPETISPWTCAACGHRNAAESDRCGRCSTLIGSRNPLSREHLDEISEDVAAHSRQGFSVPMSDGRNSIAIDLIVRRTTAPILAHGTTPIASTAISDSSAIRIYYDATHQAFTSGALEIQHVIAYEVARRLVNEQLALLSSFPGTHTLAHMAWEVLRRIALDQGSDNVRSRISAFFDEFSERVQSSDSSFGELLASEMSEEIEKQVVSALQADGRSLSDFAQIVQDGTLVSYLPAHFLATAFRKYPDRFFDGKVFAEPYANLSLSSQAAAAVRLDVVNTYASCLDDAAHFLGQSRTDRALVQRARHSLDFLRRALR